MNNQAGLRPQSPDHRSPLFGLVRQQEILGPLVYWTLLDMANYRVGSGLGQVNQVVGQMGRVNKRVILNVLKTGWANRVAGGLCEFGPTHIYT